ncbi:GH25 family lysozyme [Paenibacillus lutimineralis]|uniref:GH25 family lysozyme n=1 Tax=Paenibacillus lutimineralis TaxID=2707005 RepID=UPI00202B4D17|nr:GH25 family lysozyme [Paenibacillus lutimineralis]
MRSSQLVDYESKSGSLCVEGATVVAKAFLSEIERLTGITPILYTYPAFIGNFSGLSQYPLWIARYSTQTPMHQDGDAGSSGSTMTDKPEDTPTEWIPLGKLDSWTGGP